MGYDPSDLARQMDRLEDKVDDNLNKENSTMGDIAGLLALMQGNKGMDLPGLLALCKDKGHDRGWAVRACSCSCSCCCSCFPVAAGET